MARISSHSMRRGAVDITTTLFRCTLAEIEYVRSSLFHSFQSAPPSYIWTAALARFAAFNRGTVSFISPLDPTSRNVASIWTPRSKIYLSGLPENNMPVRVMLVKLDLACVHILGEMSFCLEIFGPMLGCNTEGN